LDGELLSLKVVLPTVKCGIQSCNIQHNNIACGACGRAGLVRRYCTHHQEHGANCVGIDHFADVSMSMTMHDLLLENSELCKQLCIIQEDKVHHQRFKVVIAACNTNKWRGGDLLGNGHDARLRRDSLCIDLAVDGKMTTLLAERLDRIPNKRLKQSDTSRRHMVVRAIEELNQESIDQGE
jgi:hypothetical protein